MTTQTTSNGWNSGVRMPPGKKGASARSQRFTGSGISGRGPFGPPQARGARLGVMLLCASALAVAGICGGTASAAPKLSILYSFRHVRGAGPVGGLLADGAGNLYGTTAGGGANGNGVVYELSPPMSGKTAWSQSVLFSFDGLDGKRSLEPLIADGAGNLYGTTSKGSTANGGVVFELSPPAQGGTAWTETQLLPLAFDGESSGGLVADRAGNLYGTADAEGASDKGEVFELSPPAQGQTVWTETVLFTFDRRDGMDPDGTLLLDAAGNIYGATFYGGAHRDGEVFELSPPAQGQTDWTETVLFSFNGTDGGYPNGSLIADTAGNFYGTTLGGGADNDGTVFELSPPKPGKTAWNERVLVSFNGADGDLPVEGVIADAAGNLFGTTFRGGANNDGEVFKLTPPARGQGAWTETVLTSFGGDIADPNGALIMDGVGNLYGTADGGSHADGIVYELTP